MADNYFYHRWAWSGSLRCSPSASVMPASRFCGRAIAALTFYLPCGAAWLSCLLLSVVAAHFASQRSTLFWWGQSGVCCAFLSAPPHRRQPCPQTPAGRLSAATPAVFGQPIFFVAGDFDFNFCATKKKLSALIPSSRRRCPN